MRAKACRTVRESLLTVADDLDKPLDGVLPWESELGLPHIRESMTNARPCVYQDYAIVDLFHKET